MKKFLIKILIAFIVIKLSQEYVTMTTPDDIDDGTDYYGYHDYFVK